MNRLLLPTIQSILIMITLYFWDNFYVMVGLLSLNILLSYTAPYKMTRLLEILDMSYAMTGAVIIQQVNSSNVYESLLSTGLFITCVLINQSVLKQPKIKKAIIDWNIRTMLYTGLLFTGLHLQIEPFQTISVIFLVTGIIMSGYITIITPKKKTLEILVTQMIETNSSVGLPKQYLLDIFIIGLLMLKQETAFYILSVAYALKTIHLFFLFEKATKIVDALSKDAKS